MTSSTLPAPDLTGLDPSRLRDVAIASEETRQNAWAVFAQLALEPPVYVQLAGVAHLVCSRHRDVVEVYIDRDRFSAEVGGQKRFDKFNGVQTLAQLDGDPHDRLRRLMNPAFFARSAQAFADEIGRIVDALHDQVERKIERTGGRFDGMADFASHLMVHVLLDAMFRLDQDQKDAFIEMQAEIAQSRVQAGEGFTDDYLAAFDRVQRAIEDLIATRRADPGDDFISHLIVAREEDDALTDRELFDQVFTVCVAALQSTATSMGGLLDSVCRYPDQFAEVRADRSLVPSAIEESLRLRGPGYLGFAKFAKVDTSVGGVPVRAGMPVLASTLGANLDPEEYPEPMRFDIHRNPRNILTFGTGAHLCMGFRLARLVLDIGLNRTLDRFPSLRFADPDYVPHFAGQISELTPTTLPLTVR
jgi:cytochrome P450